jgi:hypothetical protein
MRIFLMWMMMLVSMMAHADAPNFDDIPAEEDYLAVEQAFKPVLNVKDGHVMLSFSIARWLLLVQKTYLSHYSESNAYCCWASGI